MWILVVYPPRERPNASRSGTDSVAAAQSLSFPGAPCVPPGLHRFLQHGRGQPLSRHILGWIVAGTGRVMMRPDDGGIHAELPLRTFGHITASPQPIQNFLPGTVR